MHCSQETGDHADRRSGEAKLEGCLNGSKEEGSSEVVLWDGPEDPVGMPLF